MLPLAVYSQDFAKRNRVRDDTGARARVEFSAKVAKESINIGYDNLRSCLYGYMHAHQIG
jgi:hypothetical protein